MAVTPVELRARRDSTSTGAVIDESDLTRAQFLMWLGQQLDPNVPLYNMIQTFRIAGSVQSVAFAEAWNSVVARSDALRTTVVIVDGVPMRRIADAPNGDPEIVDLRHADDPEASANEWVENRKTVPFDLGQRLWDSALLVVDDDVAIWYLSVHHLVTDAQSFSVMYQAVNRNYALACGGRLDEAPELHQYADYVDHERARQATEAWDRDVDYWNSQAQGAGEATEFYGSTVSHQSTRTDRIVVDVDARRSDALREISRRPEFTSIAEQLSLNAIWATVLFTAIHRITGRSHIRVGTPFQTRRTPAFRDTIGLFVEIGVLDVEISDDETFASLASQVLRRTFTGLRHARPGISSAEVNRSYDVLLNHVTSHFDDFDGHPVATEWVHTGHGDRDHALRLQVTDFDGSGAFRLHFDVNAGLFGDVERTWLLEQFDAVLAAFIDDPLGRVGGFDLLDDDHRHRIDDFNDTDAPCPSATVVELFDARAVEQPDAIAAEHDGRTATYAELADASQRVAERLADAGVEPGDLVAVHASRSIEVIAAIVGVLRAGAAFVPIDPSYPAERRRFLLDDAGPTAVVLPGADAGVDVSYGELPAIVADVGPVPESRSDRSGGAGDLAYVIYTSGSTGAPKGTELTHGGLTNYVWWAKQTYQPDEPLDFALYSSLAFDLTITSVFVPLVSGGRIVVYDRPGERDGLEILDVIADDRVDIVKLTPAHLSLLIESGRECHRLGRLIVGGENFRTDVALAARALFPGGVEIFNEYGPTEAVVGCMVHRFDPALDTGRSVPIGRPAANARIHVLDRYDRPVPAGVVGEMVVSSDGVARGYRNRPELTAARFGDDPFRRGARWYRTGDLARWGADGRLQFLGRNDTQVKIRGARIEPDEIEAVALSNPLVETVVVDVVSFGDIDTGPIVHCGTCGLPSNYPGSDIDPSGDCADCRAFEVHRDDVDRYFKTPDELTAELTRARTAGAESAYDCMILVSGGKDSTYMLYQLVREYGMRPLVFTLDNGFIADAALSNVREACADLGVDLHVATTPHMNAIFTDSLERHANVCDGCYKTIYTLSMGLAREHDIGTIVTGLSRGQLFETRLADTFQVREFDPERIDDWVMDARKAYHHIDDAVYRLLDTRLFDDDRVFDDISFVDYYRFVDVDLDELYRYLHARTVWTRPPDTGRSTNCLINDVGIYVHNRQRGYHNYALPYSWDVRIGHKQREAAMDELDDEIDVERVHEILSEIGYGQLFEDLRTDRRLVAYYTSTQPVSPSELREYLADRLPEFMVPTYLVRLPELPLTVNGKVDRSALPDPRTVRQSEARYEAPRTETERQLVAIWRDVLRVPTIGVHDNFFDLGGDSITSIQIVAATNRLGWELTARDVFEHQTIGDLGARVDTGTTGGGHYDATLEPADEGFEIGDDDLARLRSQLEPIGGLDAIDDVYPLTPTQLGMVYQTLRTSSQTYFGQGTCTLRGDVDAVRLREAWRLVCRRHPTTRVRFVWSGLDVPVQVVLRDVDVPWNEIDWRGRSLAACATDLEALLRRQRDEGFDLGGGILMNFTLVRTDDADHLIWNSHHATLDGWSAHLLFREALEVYDELGSRTPSAHADVRPFRDHVRWLDRRDDAAAERWWAAYLADVETSTALPLAGRGDRSGHASVSRTLEPALRDQVTDFTRRQRITLSDLATGAWALVLGRLERRDDVLFGATVSGREDGVPGVEHMIGMFLATLPVRVRLDPDATVGDWLRGLQRDALDARSHGHLSLADLQRLTDVPGGQRLFESIIVVENHPLVSSADSDTIRPESLEFDTPSDYALALLVHPGEALEFKAVYDRDQIDESSVERLLDHLELALSSMVADASAPVGELTIVADADRQQLMQWSVGRVVDAPDRLAHRAIVEHARDHPDDVAVRDRNGAVTYGSLVHRANGVAASLRERGVRRGDCVGLLVGGDADQIAGLLGILLSGGVYVPIDPELPPGRIGAIIADTGATVVVSDDAGPVAGVPDAALLEVAAAEPSTEPPNVEIAGSDLAYVIFTSGSTGTPKGVAITHDNIAHSTAVRDEVYGETPDAFLLLSSLAFDSSMVGLFWTLCTGGALVLPAADQRRRLGHLAESIEHHDVTHVLALPSLYSLLLDEHRPGQLDTLRTVIVAGEACARDVVDLHRERCPSARLFNEYGPTEGTVWSHAVRLDDRPGTTVSIGKPIPNSVGAVLGGADQVVPVGVPGELVLGGAGIAAGYLGQPGLTEQSFVRLPHLGDADRRWYRTGDHVRWTPDGDLEFLGRTDGQVKIRGHRVELGEIDAALVDHESVRGAATVVVTAQGDTTGRRRLIACYVSDSALDEVAWKSALADRLPDYMLPSSLVRLESMPQTATGKIDRRALERRAHDHLEVAPLRSRRPVDDLERTLIAIWSDVLARDGIGVHDDFFDLGGNSLDAMRLFARIEQTTGREMLLSTLFEAPTIAEFAMLVQAEPQAPENPSLVPIKASGFKRPFYYVAPYEVSVLELGKIGRHFDRDRPFLGLQPMGLQADEQVHTTIEEMAEHYVDAIKSHQPQGPYLIGGHCDGAWIAHEMSIRLAERGETVSQVAMTDVPPSERSLPVEHRTRRLVDRLRYYASDGRLFHAIRWQVKLRLDKLVLLRFGSAASRRVRAVRLAHEAAFDRYEFRHDHRAPVHLIRSSELAVLMDEIEWYDGLGDHEHGLVVTDIASTHARLLREPETVELARVLGDALDAADAPA